jgi:predicted TIM-barrel fold metal-dependent hydrolase
MTWPIITTDSHHAVPLSLADELPDKYRQYLPRLETREDGTYLVRPQFSADRARRDADGGGEMMDSMTRALAQGIKVDTSDEAALRRMTAGNCAPVADPGYTPQQRVADMERDGIVGEMLIGNGAFGQTLPDPDANLAWTRLVNDWVADTFKDHYDRFAPGIQLPLHDLDAAAAEVERAAGLGLRPVLLPEVIPGRPYCAPEWEPVWDAANACKVPVALHLTGALARPTLAAGTKGSLGEVPGHALTSFAMASAAGMVTLGWFVNSGILERYPDLTVMLIECNAGWLAYAMQQWDHMLHSRYTEVAVRQGVLDADLEAPPSYYVRRQVKCQFMWDPAAVSLRHDIGMDVLLWGSDYPHFEGAFPDSQRWVDKLFAGVPEDEVMKIVHDNAADLLGLTV